MLKIVRSADGGSVVFALSGRLDIDHACELQTAFASEDLPVVVDFDDVRLVDRDTVPLLVGWKRKGVTLRNCPGYIRAWIAMERDGE